ncbi:MAG: type II toxin-antitoxin system HicB family antitoxin [Bacteroidetes bacterium]|nr:type II toxin-antitoxin system HicB family antitoxin [Bacteroidota bacterium]
MKTKYVYWKEGDWWIGYLDEYPAYLTQASTLEELADNLKDIYSELTSGNIPSVRKTGVLEIA